MKFLLKIISILFGKSFFLYMNKLRLGLKMVTDKNGYLIKTGYIDSKLNNTLKVNNEFLPWFNFSFIELLKERLSSDLNVFEYGSGASTLFFSNRCKQVSSIEHDKNWFDKIKILVSRNSNINLYFYNLDDNYPNSINQISPNKKYDIIVIDGRMRSDCCFAIKDNLKSTSVIILDDSDRKRYKEGISFLHSLGFSQLNFQGLKPLGYKIDQTSLFYRPGSNCFNI
tara:strand:+ start:2343 stop:3020 length:678 start_codon:yes stop_codon:yes gene_type:complete